MHDNPRFKKDKTEQSSLPLFCLFLDILGFSEHVKTHSNLVVSILNEEFKLLYQAFSFISL